MHPALNIDEILRIIFKHMSALDNYHLALTCRSFLEPALDELWNELQTPDRLFRLLPEDALQSGHHKDALILARPVSLHEWERFDCHAKRVRRVHLLAYYHIPPESRVHLQTSVLERSTSLLPNLSWIRFEDNSATSEIAAFFISASVRGIHVSFSFEYDEEEFWSNESLVQAVSKIAPSLSSLSLPGPACRDDFTPALAGAVKLQTVLFLGTVDWAIIKLLGPLPLLQRMTVNRCERSEATQEVSYASPWFPSLKSISANADTMFAVLSGMKKNNSVTAVNLRPERLGTGVVAAQLLIHLLGTSFPQLLSIRITRQRCLREEHSNTISLLPLQNCVRLRQFHITSHNNQEPTAEELVLLATAWPKLSYLNIKGHRGIRLSVLKAFSDHCPKLREIIVDLEANQQLEEGFKCGRLRSLGTLDLGDGYRGLEHATFVGAIRKQLHGSTAFRRGVAREFVQSNDTVQSRHPLRRENILSD